MGSSPDTASEPWLRALAALVPVPPAHRRPTADRATALRTLRCGEAVLDRLVAAGLPTAGVDGEEHFDPHDLYNLAILSRTGRSVPELTTSIVVRLAQAGHEAWLQPHSWQLLLTASCDRGDSCDTDAEWHACSPMPEPFGGHTLRPATTISRRGELRLEASFATAGQHLSVRSPHVREIFTALVAERRFHSVPESLEVDLAHLSAAPALNCVGAAVLLADQCRRAGYEAHARKGYLLGVLGVMQHGWTEVRDDDGERKVLDPALAMVAALADSPHPDFIELCCGSVLNRVVPGDVAPGEPLVAHRCGGTWRTPALQSQLTQTAPPLAAAS